MSLIGVRVAGSEDDMKDRFSVMELSALRNDLLQSGMLDSREAAEVLQVFLMGRGYGVSAQAAIDAAGWWKWPVAQCRSSSANWKAWRW